MSLQVFYRPKSFKTFVGNKNVLKNLSIVLKRESPPAAFLFTGPPGTGKTTLARIVKSKLKCSDADFKELNASNDRGIDAIRELIDNMKFAPLSGNRKIILLDEAHMLTKPAQEALLKSLEEPPSYVHWCICTTNPENLKEAFKRRCHTYELEALKDGDIYKLLKYICKREKTTISDKVSEKIIDLSNGSAGQALKLLDMVIDMTDQEDNAISVLQSSGTSESEVIEICRTLVNYNLNQKAKWGKIKILLKSLKSDGESARRPILGYLEKVLLNNGGIEIAYMMEEFKDNFFDSGKAGLTLACYKAIFSDE
jgi:DNA polymerase-3 subunit gamma/tau